MFRNFKSFWFKKDPAKRRFGFIENRRKKVFASWTLGGESSAAIPPPIRPRFRNIVNMLSVLAFTAGGLFLMSHTSPIPHLQRKRRTLLTPWTEEKVGGLFSRLLVENFAPDIVDPCHPVVQHLERIGHHITDSNGLPRHRYILIDSPIANAFVLPGSFVFIYTGILPVFANQSGAAMVISHELSHCLAGHALDGLLLSAPIAMAAYFTGFWFGWLSEILVQLPRSRVAEIEADTIGVHLMTKACFDPREASDVFRRLEESTSGEVKEDEDDTLSTHPATAKRIHNIKDLVLTEEIQSNCKFCGKMDWSYPGYRFLSTYKKPERFPRITRQQIEEL